MGWSKSYAGSVNKTEAEPRRRVPPPGTSFGRLGFLAAAIAACAPRLGGFVGHGPALDQSEPIGCSAGEYETARAPPSWRSDPRTLLVRRFDPSRSPCSIGSRPTASARFDSEADCRLRVSATRRSGASASQRSSCSSAPTAMHAIESEEPLASFRCVVPEWAVTADPPPSSSASAASH